MSRYQHKGLPVKKAEINKSVFEAKKAARLGSKKSPAKVSVQTEERKLEIAAAFNEGKWSFEIVVDPQVEENILDLKFLQAKQPTEIIGLIQGRNDACACGSGKKYKKCCGK